VRAIQWHSGCPSREQIEDRLGAVGFVRPYGLVHVLVAEDIALAVTRVVSDETDGGEHCALIRIVTNKLDDRVIDAVVTSAERNTLA
jgi:hypothetical protein